MNTNRFLVAALFAAVALPALADDQTVTLSGGKGSFISTAPLLVSGDDVITFAGLASGTYNYIFTLSAQNIAGLTASVNGSAAPVTSFGVISFAGLTGSSNASFSVLIKGTPSTAQALYSGELTVTLVPEPTTLGLMLAGLGAVGWVARRRS